MKLAQWLKDNEVSRIDFARKIGVSPGTITPGAVPDGVGGRFTW